MGYPARVFPLGKEKSNNQATTVTKLFFYGKSVRQLQLMMRIYDATIMGIASSYQLLLNLLNEQFKKNSPYQIKCEKYHFDTPFISPLCF